MFSLTKKVEKHLPDKILSVKASFTKPADAITPRVNTAIASQSYRFPIEKWPRSDAYYVGFNDACFWLLKDTQNEAMDHFGSIVFPSKAIEYGKLRYGPHLAAFYRAGYQDALNQANNQGRLPHSTPIGKTF